MIDASVAVDAALGSEGFSVLDDHRPVAPRLLWSEVPSALHELAWRRIVPSNRAAEALERFLDGPVVPKAPGALVREAWRVAQELMARYAEHGKRMLSGAHLQNWPNRT